MNCTRLNVRGGGSWVLRPCYRHRRCPHRKRIRPK